MSKTRKRKTKPRKRKPVVKKVNLPPAGIVRVVVPPDVNPVVAHDPVTGVVDIVPLPSRRVLVGDLGAGAVGHCPAASSHQDFLGDRGAGRHPVALQDARTGFTSALLSFLAERPFAGTTERP